MTNSYRGKTEFNLDPLAILHQLLSGSCKVCDGVEIKSSGAINAKLTIDGDSLKLDILPPEPTLIVTKFLKFKTTIDYIKILSTEITIKGSGWPEISIDLKGFSDA